MIELELLDTTHYLMTVEAYNTYMALAFIMGLLIGTLIGLACMWIYYSNKVRAEYAKTLSDKEYRAVKEYVRR